MRIEKFIDIRLYVFYDNYKIYKMEEITTIAAAKEAKEKIREFGNKGETYSMIIMKIMESAKKRQL